MAVRTDRKETHLKAIQKVLVNSYQVPTGREGERKGRDRNKPCLPDVSEELVQSQEEESDKLSLRKFWDDNTQ